MKILYFSGTGNSLYVANEISRSFQGEMLSIPQLLATHKWVVESDTVGIIFPVYYLGIPDMVDEFLNKVNIKANYIFSICTYGMFSFNTKSLMNNYNFIVDYTTELLMEDNFIPLFDMEKVKSKENRYNTEIQKIIRNIGIHTKENKKNFVLRRVGNIIAKFTKPKRIGIEDEKFYIDEKCNLCGVCKKVCVANNINIHKKVEFKHTCQQCMACISFCPLNAIHHTKEKNSARYTNKNIKAKDIMTSNDY
ncbi:MAG: EFR1 family ferrodoxin [Breznakia sp.]